MAQIHCLSKSARNYCLINDQVKANEQANDKFANCLLAGKALFSTSNDCFIAGQDTEGSKHQRERITVTHQPLIIT